ncbi:PqqD family peptide modification chaperone [Longispora albida]|uniref:PqqD family peptide modification chaperone n=1 Tax=Longispora albida TaxID=203523 RepID=UPI0003749A80|nr:PqqD family peptide modification chaperone [Longispora albida]
MLCHACRVHVRRDFPYCLHCGILRPGVPADASGPPRLTVDGGAEHALSEHVTTVGRGPGNDVVIDHPSVSRSHARIERTAAGYVVEDLGSFNGTRAGARALRSSSCRLADGMELLFGDVPVVFEQPRADRTHLWDGSEDTIVHGGRPQRHGAVAVKQLPDGSYVLRNTSTGRYIELDERDLYVWRLLDGRRSVLDLVVEYADEYGELALAKIERALRVFADEGLLHGTQARPARRWYHVEWSIGGLDGLLGRAYRSFGWVFFTGTGKGGLWGLIVAGLLALWAATGQHRLLDFGGPLGIVAAGAGYLLATLLHEAAHALTVKSYGRRVNRAGVALILGLPFAFVDTSDMWLASRRARMAVTLAGPLTTAALAGLASIGAAAGSAASFQLAVMLYLSTVYNLNPLLPTDGYQALSDLVRRPALREESFGYLFRREGGLWSDLRQRRAPRIGLALYALLALATALLTAAMTPPLVFCVIMVALFPVWLRLGWRRRKLSRGLAGVTR